MDHVRHLLLQHLQSIHLTFACVADQADQAESDYEEEDPEEQETLWDAVPEEADEQAALESDDSSTTAYNAPASTSQPAHASGDGRYIDTQLDRHAIVVTLSRLLKLN